MTTLYHMISARYFYKDGKEVQKQMKISMGVSVDPVHIINVEYAGNGKYNVTETFSEVTKDQVKELCKGAREKCNIPEIHLDAMLDSIAKD